MKHPKLLLFLFTALLILAPVAVAQDVPSPVNDRPDDRRPNLFAELGLAPEQIQQIRRMNQDRQPAIRQARQRMGDAQRNLDMAIYGDAIVTDAEFQTRLKEFQAAQSELARLRFESELAVRKILTAEQLVRFRQLRRRFAEANQDRMFPNRRMQRRDQVGPPAGKDAAPRKPLN